MTPTIVIRTSKVVTSVVIASEYRPASAGPSAELEKRIHPHLGTSNGSWRTLAVDENVAYSKTVTEMQKDGELWRRSRSRQVKYLNNTVEQDHRCVKRLSRTGWALVGFGRPGRSARR